MSGPTRAQLRMAAQVLKGESAIVYAEVAKRYGLDDSFVWTPDTFWCYVDDYMREMREHETRRLEVVSMTIRLRTMAKQIRTTAVPIKDIVPLLQQAADLLEKNK